MGFQEIESEASELLENIHQSPQSNKKERYAQLISYSKWNELSPDVYLNLAGYLGDISFDLEKEQGTKETINLLKKLLEREDLGPKHYTKAHYQLSVTYEDLTDKEDQWKYENHEEQIFHLRKALNEDGLEEVSDEIAARINTNLGNILSKLGRTVEGLEYWNAALEHKSDHAMALGNRGMGKKRYAETLPDPGHRAVIYISAKDDLEKALSLDNIHRGARKRFEESYDQLRDLEGEFFDSDKPIEDMKEFSMGESEEEKEYREWCLKNKLFLNPLNDIVEKSVAARDIMHLPNMRFETDKPLPYPGLFNQMKQEFVSARYLFYEGMNRDNPHFSDRESLVTNTLDYPVYSYSAEQMKAGLRMSYSLFDKIAFFLNDYLEFNHDESGVDFNKIWFENLNYNNGLKSDFRGRLSDNVSLLGLYWLKRDFYGGKLNVEESTDMVAEDLGNMRNYLEHKYLKVHENWATPVNEGNKEKEKVIEDDLSHSISREELEEMGLEMLKTARAGLIYLSTAVFQEEYRRRNKRGLDKDNVVEFRSEEYKDEWKR